MKWSYRVARVAGIDIRVHATFAFVLVFGAVQWGVPHGAPGAAFGVLAMLFLFGCVVLHELGHSLVARAFALPVREIVLLPIGGVAKLEKNPEKPLHELLIALAGPLVNVGLALLLALAVDGATLQALNEKGLVGDKPLVPSAETLVLWLLAANVSLAVFNMIPAFPLDGGRVLRALLAMGMGFPRATRTAAAIGQVLAVGLGVFAIVTGQMLLALIAFLIFIGAGQEQAEEQARSVLSTLRVGDAYNKYALTLSPGDHVSRVVDYILTSYQPDFAVLQGTQLLGAVTRQDVLKALATDGRDQYVAGIMDRDVTRVQASEPLDAVRRLMLEKGVRIVGVFDAERYLGLVSLEDLSEALLVVTFVERQNALRRAAEGPQEM
ncbi:MAG: site-2 protease family protein [Acidobacteria bacterium]|nr:MAG: site-2 protease family protein [Acidobacteriota bacterium]